MKTNLLIAFLIISLNLTAQLRVGDPGVTFDQSKMDARYPQMQKWITAGVRGGIPFLEDQEIKITLNDGSKSSDINVAINTVADLGGGAILLRNGEYIIDEMISMRSKVSIIGESRDGVICTIYLTSGSGFFFGTGDKNCGLYRLTVQGSWGRPKYDWNISSPLNDELPNNDNISIKFSGSEDCWLDKVTILNSAQDPMRCNAQHTTFRDLIVDGAHKKAGGAQGYFFIQKGYNLITGCKITHLRHISLQGGGVEYNVVYDNDFRQEVSFHSGDDGNNLIENNRITLPADMPPGTSSPQPDYYAIMGAWSIQHTNSADTNYIYKNQCVEYNHAGNPTPWSDPRFVYVGPRVVKPADPSTNFPALSEKLSPIGGTFYPIVLGEEINYTAIPTKLEAENYAIQSGIKTETTSDEGGGQNIGFINTDDYTSYLVNVSQSGTYDFTFRVASNTDGGEIEVLLDEIKLGTAAIGNTGGWQVWENIKISLTLSTGNHELKLVYKGSDTRALFNINWVDIQNAIVTGLEVSDTSKAIEFYPNPTSGLVYMDKETVWELYSTMGLKIQEGKGDEIDLSQQENGVYLIKIGNQVLRILKL